MKLSFNLIIKRLDLLLLTYFGLGLFPWAPGTIASFFTLPLLMAFSHFQVPPLFLCPIFLIFTFGQCFLAHKCQLEFQVHDPSWIVIDEVVGMILAWLIFPAKDPLSYFLLFALFRFFDIVKIWPASYFDQKVTHGYGTIVDDLISGLYTGIAMHCIYFFLP